MQKRVSDLPPLLPPGVHPISMLWLQVNCVDAFPLSRNRPQILEGLKRILRQAEEIEIPGRLIVDGSYLTEEIEPSDIDFVVCVTPEFYESCNPVQLKFLEWIRDDFKIKESHLCDCFLWVEYPQDHPEWFQGMQDGDSWVKFYSTSITHKTVRGVGNMELGERV
jgi:hypothetical protein